MSIRFHHSLYTSRPGGHRPPNGKPVDLLLPINSLAIQGSRYGFEQISWWAIGELIDLPTSSSYTCQTCKLAD